MPSQAWWGKPTPLLIVTLSAAKGLSRWAERCFTALILRCAQDDSAVHEEMQLIMEMQLYILHVVPFVILVYLVFLLFIHPPRAVVLATLIGGLTIGIINALADLLAYYAHWWHYAIDGLTFHLPLPFYFTPILVYGGIVYMLIWRLWRGRWHWLALLLLVGIPLFGFVRDLYGSAVTQSTYLTWDSFLAGPLDFLLWLLMFYVGFLVFRRLAPTGLVVQHPK